MDSWDQAPAASALEADVTGALAAEIYPHRPTPDALITTGGTEANQLALLLARERNGPVQTIHAANYYLLMLLFTAVVVLVFRRSGESRIGRAWVAIREDETAATAMGINAFRLKLIAFALGATLAGLAASALNPSMDSWDQAPAASALEADVTGALAAEIYPHRPTPDALITTGGTEANQLALLLARERNGPVQTIHAAN
ncbi:hypothetical protein EAO76_42025, partial [Streptomyces sp. sk2.1]